MPQKRFNGNQTFNNQQGFYSNKYQNIRQQTQNNHYQPYQQGPFNNMHRLSYNRDKCQKLVMFYFLATVKKIVNQLNFFIDTL